MRSVHVQAGWSQARFRSICEQVEPFLLQCGFQAKKLAFIPCGAIVGENLVRRTNATLNSWYDGPTLIEQLGEFSLGSPFFSLFRS
jgi:elongation factor 1 alpha-like protein